VLPDLVDTIARALRLRYVAIELRVDDDWVPAAASGVPVDDVLVLPLTHHGASIGRLLVALRRRGEPYSPADRALLDDVARQAGVAAHGVGLAVELQAARERLVTTREEERRRLRHRLHDGVGPTLAAVAMGVEAVSTLADRDPAAAGEALERLQAEVRATTAEVRGIARELRPPALDDLGLERALRERAAELAAGRDGVVLEVAVEGAVEDLPAALEVAAYRVADGALTAAATGSGSARIVLAGGGELTVRAALEPAPAADVRRTALDGMRIACADVGGTLRTLGGSGLAVEAVLPRRAVLAGQGLRS
jgi:two-component system, NarL family, sensor kinase